MFFINYKRLSTNIQQLSQTCIKRGRKRPGDNELEELRREEREESADEHKIRSGRRSLIRRRCAGDDDGGVRL